MKIFVLLFAFIALVSSAVAAKNAICNLPHSYNGDRNTVSGAYMPSWTYKSDTNECVEFIYYGSEGNDNRFSYRFKCEEMCKV